MNNANRTKPAFVLGLTGGIGSGKTAASNLFAQLGIAVIDADVVAREVVAAGSPALKTISEHFGQDMLLPDGSLDRRQLRQKIFTDPEQKIWLETLLHPLIRESITEQLDAASSPYVILTSPLLLETGQDKLTDRILLIDAPETLQLKRTSVRDSTSQEAVQLIMDTQMSREERLQKADDVIVNDGGLQELETRVKTLHHRYLEKCKA